MKLLYISCLKEVVCSLFPLLILPAGRDMDTQWPSIDPVDENNTIAHVGRNVGLWSIFWRKIPRNLTWPSLDVTWQSTGCFISIKRGGYYPWNRSKLWENKSVISMYLLCRLGIPVLRNSFTLITLAQWPGLKATNLQQHKTHPHPHCSLSPFYKLKALWVAEAQKEMNWQLHLINVQWAVVIIFWSTVTKWVQWPLTVTWVPAATSASCPQGSPSRISQSSKYRHLLEWCSWHGWKSLGWREARQRLERIRRWHVGRHRNSYLKKERGRTLNRMILLLHLFLNVMDVYVKGSIKNIPYSYQWLEGIHFKVLVYTYWLLHCPIKSMKYSLHYIKTNKELG